MKAYVIKTTEKDVRPYVSPVMYQVLIWIHNVPAMFQTNRVRVGQNIKHGVFPDPDLDKPRGFSGGEDAVRLEPQVQPFPLEHLLVENDQL